MLENKVKIKSWKNLFLATKEMAGSTPETIRRSLRLKTILLSI